MYYRDNAHKMTHSGLYIFMYYRDIAQNDPHSSESDIKLYVKYYYCV